ncbi:MULTISPECIES: hypothetical protein [unclassified Moorena]|uniref:hypothetical protein n=1 Tax=unclassified Moorena TaxID=2683338 RepID=UPI0010541D04|nr:MULTISPECIES: hypothetical protein [unclassified Moorena]NEP34848.1 hypothetical protein [Moorena sp. SIO3B2]NEQ05430.1 hypothetical protein [Moorena sp. SIO4E2]NES45892.1 hypothetical protein [Moorena sp. SIO2C4]
MRTLVEVLSAISYQLSAISYQLWACGDATLGAYGLRESPSVVRTAWPNAHAWPKGQGQSLCHAKRMAHGCSRSLS